MNAAHDRFSRRTMLRGLGDATILDSLWTRRGSFDRPLPPPSSVGSQGTGDPYQGLAGNLAEGGGTCSRLR